MDNLDAIVTKLAKEDEQEFEIFLDTMQEIYEDERYSNER